MDYKRRNGAPFTGGVSQAKRSKMAGEWEDSPSHFEEELSMFDDVDMDSEELEGELGMTLFLLVCIQFASLV